MIQIKTGDIIEIKISDEYVYAQYTHKHPTYGALIRVFEKKYSHRPDQLENITKSAIQFSTFIPLKAMIKTGVVKVLGNLSIENNIKNFPVFRAGMVDPKIAKVKVWWLWDGKVEKRIGKLTTAQKRLPIRGVWNDTLLFERIESGWTPEKDITT